MTTEDKNVRRPSDVQNNSEGLRTESATPVALKVGDWVEVISVARVTELDGKGLAHTVIETDSDGWVSASAVTRVDLDDPRLDAISGPNEPTCAECGKGPTVAHYCTICNDVIGKLVDADERRRSEAPTPVSCTCSVDDQDEWCPHHGRIEYLRAELRDLRIERNERRGPAEASPLAPRCFHVDAGKRCTRYLEGSEGERAAIVEWLRDLVVSPGYPHGFAQNIEDGVHKSRRRERGQP